MREPLGAGTARHVTPFNCSATGSGQVPILAIRPRAAPRGRIAFSDREGGCFSLSNLGALGGRGASLVIADLDETGAAKVAQSIGETGARAIGVDVAKRTSVKAMVDAAVKAFGRLDATLNNAGIA